MMLLNLLAKYIDNNNKERERRVERVLASFLKHKLRRYVRTSAPPLVVNNICTFLFFFQKR